MWFVEFQAADDADVHHGRLAESQEEALALCAHLRLRGHRIRCIRREDAVIMNAEQITFALSSLNNRHADA